MMYYLLRSKIDGQYLVARPKGKDTAYLLLFREDFEALSYLSAHAAEVANRFTVESLASDRVNPLLQRWGFQGVGLVQDPLVPTIEFMLYD